MSAGSDNLLPISKEILTYRELEYLSLVAMGCRNSIIATKLCVTKSTVKKTLEKIFRKLNAKDRANAVAIAFIHNLITPKTIAMIYNQYFLEEEYKKQLVSWF